MAKPVTDAELLDEAQRELATRRRVYPRWVEGGKLTQKVADLRIACALEFVKMAEERVAKGRLL